jgi:hypothetical protein
MRRSDSGIIAGMTQALDQSVRSAPSFFGPWVVRATFVMAMFGWGVGFYGPSIFLHTVVERTGWSLALVSTAVTVHYLFGALVVTRLPMLHRRFGVGPTAVAGAVSTALGVLGWSVASAPWQLFTAALLSGAGWVAMGAVAVNAAIAPWYESGRPMALAKAYNGASVGGVVFSPLWVLLIAQWGFTNAAAVVGVAMIAVMVALDRGVFTRTPGRLGQCPDGAAPSAAAAKAHPPKAPVLTGRLLWRDRGFVTLALGMAAGLFAQIGMLAHLFSLLVPAFGAQAAGLTMGFATACAIGGRLVVASVLPSGSNRRTVAALAYGVQLTGTVMLLLAGEQRTGLILLGTALYGSGIGNATSLPPLIAQAEFAKADVPRVVAMIVALGQATYAFAPATFGLLLSASTVTGARIGFGSSLFFLAVAAVQGVAILCFLAGRKPT